MAARLAGRGGRPEPCGGGDQRRGRDSQCGERGGPDGSPSARCALGRRRSLSFAGGVRRDRGIERVVYRFRVLAPEVRCWPRLTSGTRRARSLAGRSARDGHGPCAFAEPSACVSVFVGGRGPASRWGRPLERRGPAAPRLGGRPAHRDEFFIGVQPLTWAQVDHVARARRAGAAVGVLVFPCHK